jgi:hypothetical protein
MSLPRVAIIERVPRLETLDKVGEGGRPLYDNTTPFPLGINGEIHWMPRRFETDGASVPRLLWSVIPPHHPEYSAAVLVHDYAYGGQIWPKAYSDQLMLAIMIELGVPAWKRQSMYRAVQWFGAQAYRKNSGEHVAQVRALSGIVSTEMPLVGAGEPVPGLLAA